MRLTNFLRMRKEKIILDVDNRMLRFGFGKHKGIWFVRIDLWIFVRIRLYVI